MKFFVDFSLFLKSLDGIKGENPYLIVTKDSPERGIVFSVAVATRENASSQRYVEETSPYFPTILIGKQTLKMNDQLISDSAFKELIADLAKTAKRSHAEIIPSVSTFEKVSGERAEAIFLILVREGVTSVQVF